MDLLQRVIKKRSEDQAKTRDVELLSSFANRVKKLKGEGPLPLSDEPEVTLEVVSINIRDIEVPPNYIRKSIGDISSLAKSIQVYGMQQPIKVVKIRGTKKYRLVFGRRRIKAAQEIGLEAVPCIVELVSQADRLMMLALTENISRSRLSPVEEGGGYKELTKNSESAIVELAKNLGRSLEYIKHTIDFLNFPDNVRKEVILQSDKFSWEILRLLMMAFRTSKVHGKKLFLAISSGQVKTAAEAEYFLKSL